MKSKLKYIYIILMGFAAFGFQKLYADNDTKTAPEVKVTDATLKLSFDTTGGKHIIATVNAKDPSGAVVPVKDVTVAVFIKKSFGMLPVTGDNMITDETGTVTVNLPKNMPGDKDNMINFSSKVDGDPKVGDLEATGNINWGVPAKIENNLNKRALWAAAASAPISLVVAVNSILLLVWGTIFYILFKLITISKSGKDEKLVKS